MSKSVPRSRDLLKESLKLFRRHWGRLITIALVVALPTGLVTLFLSGGDDALAPYLSMAAILLNLVLIWTIAQLDGGKKVGLKQAYYDGGRAVVRFFLVTLTLALMLLPLMIGAIIFATGVIGDGSVTVSIGEQVLLGFVWLLLAAPTMFWLTRYLLGMVTVVLEDHHPVQALRSSKKLVRGQSWKVAGRMAALGLVCVLILALPAALLSVFIGSDADIARASLQLITTVVILPFTYIYLYKLYQALK